MGEEKQKTYQEWQDLVGGLGDKLFEELSYRLLNKLGFEEVKHRGGSADGGRDLEGKKTYIEPDKRTKFLDNYWFECKCYSSTIPWNEISDKLYSAVQSKVDKFIVLSNRGLSPQAQDKVKEFMATQRVKVIEWCGFEFLNLLFQQPELCDAYFHGIPIPNSPPIQNKSEHILKAAINLSEGFGIELETKLSPGFQVTEKNIKDIILNSLRNLGVQQINLDNDEKSRLFCNIAMIFSQFGLNLDAMTFIDKSIELNKSVSALVNKAIIFERLHNLQESVKIYKELLKSNKENLAILNNLARNLKDQFLLNEALEVINSALKIDPENISSINNKANILKNLKKYSEALDLVNKKIGDNSSIILQKTKVDVLIEAYDLKEAFRINEQLLNLDPSDVDLINNRGVIYEHNSRYQNPEKYLKLAFESFGEARNKKEDYVLALSNQVVCILNSGNLSGAEALTNAGLSMDQTSPFLLDNKSKIEMQRGNLKSALEYIEKALRISSQERFLITKAQILIISRKNDQVDKLCRRLLAVDSQNTEAMRILAESLRRRHQISEANSWLKKANSSGRKYISLLE